jgi:pyruvate dehydrogenase E1 component
MASFIAAGTAYASHGLDLVPFYIFYSMFGFQRIGDLAWAAADQRTRGFLLGATAGRTTLNGEGLQHEDGHSHLLASTVPNVVAYDPAYAYEIAVIVREGIRRMYEKMEDVFYYLTLANQPYAMPAMPEGVEDGILRGMYLLHRAADENAPKRVQLLGTGPILPEAVAARILLAEKFGIEADVWSVTSYKALHRDAADVERWNRLHPSRPPRTPYFTECLASRRGPVVAASDYVRALPESVARFSPTPMTTLGTDGFGRSDGRRALRDFFEVDARHIALAALAALSHAGQVETPLVEQAISTLDIDPERANPILR